MNIESHLLTMGAAHGRNGIRLAPQGVVIHYTAKPCSPALAIRDYYENGAGGTGSSSHYIVGLDGEIIRCVPENERAGHAGKSYGPAWNAAAETNNAKFLSVECCHPNPDGKFNDNTIKSLTDLTAHICGRYNLDPIRDVYRHYDVSGKICPLYYVNNPGEWAALKNGFKERLEQIKAAAASKQALAQTASKPALTQPAPKPAPAQISPKPTPVQTAPNPAPAQSTRKPAPATAAKESAVSQSTQEPMKQTAEPMRKKPEAPVAAQAVKKTEAPYVTRAVQQPEPQRITPKVQQPEAPIVPPSAKIAEAPLVAPPQSKPEARNVQEPGAAQTSPPVPGDASSRATTAWAWAAEYGIFDGIQFKGPATREELVVMMYNFYQVMKRR